MSQLPAAAAVGDQRDVIPRDKEADAVRLQHVSLTDFRNLERVVLEVPPPGLAVIGQNAQGKTNLLEAIYYFQLMRSFRGTRDADVARFGAPGFHIVASISGSPRDVPEMSVGFDRQGRRKKVLLNRAQPARLSEAYGTVPTVMCSPDDRALISGAPLLRRRYLDVMLAAVSQRYLFALQQYRVALVQRNAALREFSRRRGDESALAVWEPALAAHGAIITVERVAWTAQFREEFARICAAIGEIDPVELSYATRTDPGNARRSLTDRLEATRAADIRRGVTHAGPHRDELRLSLAGREMREFASAGQQRTAALALRMLEALTMLSAQRRYPVLLLDDPFAELDRVRAGRILGLLRDIDPGQTFLCVPREDDIPPELSRLERSTIAGGNITPAS
ncbi:MAG TPA: DNA replication and repair protein RecF [Gemmatimonadaceae bacterium]|nr:DNA replication and repair protein RecF [Gemmatimonadaceae bacterium]